MLTLSDLDQIAGRGITADTIGKQIDHFRKGFPYIRLARPATQGDGILCFDDKCKSEYIRYFTDSVKTNRIVKFVPASGAASRMFKHLFEFQEKYGLTPEGFDFFTGDQGFNSVFYLLTHLTGIAFYDDLCARLEKDFLSVEGLTVQRDFKTLIDFILSERGLNYANLPKGIIKFHKYPGCARTSAEEHLVEAASYAKDDSGVARIHFTISPEHQEKFDTLFSSVRNSLEQQFGVQFDISYSVQKPATDTLAVNSDNSPGRNPDGSLLFRPGGHGALLSNLNEIDADLIFIKNIDNVVPDRLKETTFDYKKLLGGYLLALRDIIFGFLRKAETVQLTTGELNEMLTFVKEKLYKDGTEAVKSLPDKDKQAGLVSLLDRPIRVCGMVKNEGEPGGGPFWVFSANGEQSLQIVETSQIDLKDPRQAAIVQASTHFNPVDLVCSIKNPHGRVYNLKEFVDEETGFISLKSTGGKTVKAQELPGLWNGGMAGWITIFVEVPIVTFNPVKTVNDLLRKEHTEGETP